MGERLEEKSNQDSIQKIAKDDQLDHKPPQVKEKIAEDFSGSQKEGLEKPSLNSLDSKLAEIFPWNEAVVSKVKEILIKLKEFSQDFLSDLLTVKSGKSLGKERFWSGKREELWKQIHIAINKLNTAHNEGESMQGEQLLAKVSDQWTSLQLEQLRGESDQERIQWKLHQLLDLYQKGNPQRSREEFREQYRLLEKNVWGLTAEWFLDWYLEKLTAPWEKDKNLYSDSLDALYSTWKDGEVIRIGLDKNGQVKSFEEWEKMLKWSESNNEELKKNAESIKRAVLEKGELSGEALKQEFAKIDAAWQKEAKNTYGMLNRSEVIRSAFVWLENPKDYTTKDLIKKIQAIGQVCYPRSNIQVNGVWSAETQAIVMDLKIHPLLKDAEEWLDAVLRANRDYAATAKRASERLAKAYEKGKYEGGEAQVMERFSKGMMRPEANISPEKPSPEKVKLESAQDIGIQRNASLQQALASISDEDVESTIPREIYLQEIAAFIQGDSTLSVEDKIRLPELILEGSWSGEVYKWLKMKWDASLAKKNFLASQKEILQQKILKTMRQKAKESRDHFFTHVGLPLKYDSQLSKAYETRYKKTPGTYSVFTDANNPNDQYVFNHRSWCLSMKNTTKFNQQQKEINFNATKFKAVLRFPTPAEQVENALNISSYLPNLRPWTERDLDTLLNDELSKKISHTAGDIETSIIHKNIESNRLNSSILRHAQRLLNLEPSQWKLSEQSHKAQYEMLVPLLNTLPQCSIDELRTVDRFFSELEAMLNDNSAQKEGAHEKNEWNQIFSLLSKPWMKKSFKEQGPRKSKTDFWIGLLFQSLEKPLPWSADDLEHRILDVRKMKLLSSNNLSHLRAEQASQQPDGQRYSKLTKTIANNYIKTAETEQQHVEQQQLETLEKLISNG